MTDYGQDFSCATDLETTLVTVSGRTTVIHAIVRRLGTPRGRLKGDPDYGFDLAGYCNDDVTPRDIAWIKSQIEAECLKDERVLGARATVTLAASDVMTVTLSLELLDADSFDLVLSVSAVNIEVLSVE